MNKNLIFNFIIFYFYQLDEKFDEKQSMKSFLVGKNYVSQSVDIFNRYCLRFVKEA